MRNPKIPCVVLRSGAASRPLGPSWCMLALVGLLAGCSSEAGPVRPGESISPPAATDGTGTSPTSPSTPSMPTATPTATTPIAPIDPPSNGVLGPIALRRLNSLEYDATVQALLMVAPGSTAKFLPDDTNLGYKNMADVLRVTPLLAERYAATARNLAAGLDVAAVAPCAVGAAPRGCAETFVQSFGALAFRRPFTALEVSQYAAIFEGELGRTNYANGIRLVVEAMLQSPHFLYKTELGEGAGQHRKLTSFEMASQISYLATGSMPDAELRQAAQAGQLELASEREAQLRRLLATERGVSWFTSFVTQWLGIDDAGYLSKDQGAYPSYTSALSAAVAEESRRFIGSVITDHGGSLPGLFTATWSVANDKLAAHYGLPPGSATWQQVTLPTAERLGILTQSAFLVSTSKQQDSFPIRRGKVLRSRVLCADVPPPPPGIMIEQAPLSDDLTTRERFLEHQKLGTVCAGCHRLIDPLGFGFENYEPTGAYRTTENGHPIDASGDIVEVAPEIDGPFANALEFTQRVAPSAVLADCVAREALRWAIGRVTQEAPAEDPRVLRDWALIQAGATRLKASSSDLRELLAALVLRDEYPFRSDE